MTLAGSSNDSVHFSNIKTHAFCTSHDTLHSFAPAPVRLTNVTTHCNTQVQKFDSGRYSNHLPQYWNNQIFKWSWATRSAAESTSTTLTFCNFAMWQTFSRFSLILWEFFTQQLRVGPAHSSPVSFARCRNIRRIPGDVTLWEMLVWRKAEKKGVWGGGLRNNVLQCPTLTPKARPAPPKRWHLRDEITPRSSSNKTKHWSTELRNTGRPSAEQPDEVVGCGHKHSLFQECLWPQQLLHSSEGTHSFRGGKKHSTNTLYLLRWSSYRYTSSNFLLLSNYLLVVTQLSRTTLLQSRQNIYF